MNWVDGVLLWMIGWLTYEVLAVLLMAEWHVKDWVLHLPIRAVVWPVFAVMAAVDLIAAWREYGTIELWWWRR